MAQKSLGEGGPYRVQGPPQKVPHLQFCHFGPFSGQRAAPTLMNVGKVFKLSGTMYNWLSKS